jgi:hypothetical protein
MKHLLTRASEILGVSSDADITEIQYAYYRLMSVHHPDKHKGDPQATRRSALINEARDILLGREIKATLLHDSELVADIVCHPVSDMNVLSYEEWLKSQFLNMEQHSIWPC